MVHPSQWTRWRSVASLIVLFLASVLNQADRWVFPALAPAGLRCYVPPPDACNTSNATGSDPTGSTTAVPINGETVTTELEAISVDQNFYYDNSTSSYCAKKVGCIDFDSYDQGILTGPAFAAVYVLSGLPLSRLADTSSRLLVLAIGVTFWSGMVFATGFVKTTWQLYLTRMGLGIGEVSHPYSWPLRQSAAILH